MNRLYITCLLLWMATTTLFAVTLDNALDAAKSKFPIKNRLPFESYMDLPEFQALEKVVIASSIEDLAEKLIVRKDPVSREILIFLIEKNLKAGEYINLLAILSDRADDDESLMQRMLFPMYDKRGIIALNYLNPEVKELIARAKKYCRNDERLTKTLKETEQGRGFKKILSLKMEGINDNFHCFPMLQFDKKRDFISIIGLVIYKYNIDCLVKKAECCEVEEARDNIRIYRKIMQEDALISRAQAIKDSAILFDANTPLLRPDARDPGTQKLYKAMKSGRALLVEQILQTEDEEILGISIDALYLTVSSDEDWDNYLLLLTCKRTEVREYAYKRIRFPRKINFELPLSKQQVDLLSLEYQEIKPKYLDCQDED